MPQDHWLKLSLRLVCQEALYISLGMSSNVLSQVLVSGSNTMLYQTLTDIFRCHKKSKQGKHHLALVNDIAFSPMMKGAFVTGDNEGYVTIWDAKREKFYPTQTDSNSSSDVPISDPTPPSPFTPCTPSASTPKKGLMGYSSIKGTTLILDQFLLVVKVRAMALAYRNVLLTCCSAVGDRWW
ncbi:hypothetical protein AHAS_Ahas13G0136000 [Arachis hypogaea]